MLLTRHVLVALACCLWSAAPAPARQPDTVTVLITIEFAPSITSKIVRTLAMREAARIWQPYGVDIIWAENGVEPSLRLHASVERDTDLTVIAGSGPVLGRATVDPSGETPGPIDISFDTIDRMLQDQTDNSGVHELQLGRALGRVLAHELGHILLGSPAYHDPDGLMRATFTGGELAYIDPYRYRLADRSVRRLQARLARLTEAHMAERAASNTPRLR